MTVEPGHRRERWHERLTHGAPLAVLLAVGLFLAYQILPILQLVAIAMLVALVLRTVVRGLESLGTPRWLSVLILLAGILGFGALAWFVLIPRIEQEIQKLLSGGPGTLGSLQQTLGQLPFVPDQIEILQRLRELLTGFVSSLPSFAFTLVSALAAIVAAVFLAVYFAINPGLYTTGILRLVPYDQREGVRDFLNRLGDRLRGWIVGTLIVAAFVGTFGGLGLWALGMPLPLTFGLIAGALNVIPFAGSIVGGALPALLALTISPVKALLVVALFVVINQIEGNVLQPLIMGRQVKVPEAMIIVSVLLLATLLGPVIGALLAVPTAVVVSVLLDELAEREPTLGGETEKPDSTGEEQSEKDKGSDS